MNTLLNLFPVSFFIVLLAKSSNERNILTDLNNCHNRLFMLCSYKNVLGNLDCIDWFHFGSLFASCK